MKPCSICGTPTLETQADLTQPGLRVDFGPNQFNCFRPGKARPFPILCYYHQKQADQATLNPERRT